jgi:hypothetical protein
MRPASLGHILDDFLKLEPEGAQLRKLLREAIKVVRPSDGQVTVAPRFMV